MLVLLQALAARRADPDWLYESVFLYQYQKQKSAQQAPSSQSKMRRLAYGFWLRLSRMEQLDESVV